MRHSRKSSNQPQSKLWPVTSGVNWILCLDAVTRGSYTLQCDVPQDHHTHPNTRPGHTGETQVERTTHTLSKRVSELQSALAAAWRMSGDAHSRSDPGGLAGGQAASG